MSYDPIHDTYTPAKPVVPEPVNGSSSSSIRSSAMPLHVNSTDSAPVVVKAPITIADITSGESNPPPPLPISSNVSLSTTPATSKPFSISTLVDEEPPVKTSSISNLINANQTEEEEEDYETDVNTSTAGASMTTSVSNGTTATSNGDETKASGKRKKRKYTNSTVPKCRHLKKSDGEPFWRKDIQYDFLKALFDDETACFTNNFPFCEVTNANNDAKIPFSDLYIRTLVESSKCSKVLKERMIRYKELGKSVSKVCLLVNAGRMNTTINFVPEMRSTLRTYHSIPSLQADPQFGGSKPLQDTPRLKSILKAVCEDENIPKDLDEILEHPAAEKPNTNIIQIIFLLSNYAHGIPMFEADAASNNFSEFFLNSKIHPANRAKRMLWLLYTYLETDFTPEQLEKNPFGGKTIPPVELIPEDELAKFDKDTEFEIEYSEKMLQTRIRYLNDEEHNNSPKRGNKAKKLENEDESFTDDNENEDHELKTENGESTRKRPYNDENATKRKRGKRNLALHQTLVPSPLAKNVITFSVEKLKKDDSDETVGTGDFLKHQNSKLKSNIEVLQFPIDDVDELIKEYCQSPRVPSHPDDHVAVDTYHHIVELSRPVVRQVRTSSKASTASFNKKTTILGNWLYRYFRYKKSIGNKLLGMEWEDIRYDLINGLESYLYQKFGESLKANELAKEADDEAEQPNAHAGANDSTAVTKKDDNKFEYLPLHDFDRANEKTIFILQLTTFCNEWFIERLSNQFYHTRQGELDAISFDFENENVNFSF